MKVNDYINTVLSIDADFETVCPHCGDLENLLVCVQANADLDQVQIGNLKLSKELKEKLLGSDREGLGLGIRIAILKQIADLKLSIFGTC